MMPLGESTSSVTKGTCAGLFARKGAQRCLVAIGIFAYGTGLCGEDDLQAKRVQAEYKIKAACLFRFMQFIEWPKSTFADESAPLIVAVLGKDPFGDLLDDAMKNKRVGGRDVVVKRFSTSKEVEACHLVFVSSSESGTLKEALEALKPHHAATVGETEDFLKAGGIFRFFVAEGKVQFEVSKEAAKESGIEIRSQLLRLGK